MRTAQLLIMGLARVGIIALVDEATGYQYMRQRDALEQLLESYLSDELREWVRTFPTSYFRELCRLRGVEFRGDMRLPQYFGHLTNNIVYKRLHPHILEELQTRTGKNIRQQWPCKFHQWLSADTGHTKLSGHLTIVVGLMRISKTWDEFERHLDHVAPMPIDAPLFGEQIREDGFQARSANGVGQTEGEISKISGSP